MKKAAPIMNVRVDDRLITFVLADGRELSIPTARSPRLLRATPDARATWDLGGAGTYVEWPTVDEHIGIWTMLGVSEDAVLEAAGFEMERAPVT